MMRICRRESKCRRRAAARRLYEGIIRKAFPLIKSALDRGVAAKNDDKLLTIK
jgi:hypothetical protein